VIGLDTSVLLRWVLDDVPEQAELAGAFMSTLTPERPGFVTEVTVMEMAWVLRSGYGFTPSDVLGVLEALLRSEVLEFDDGESVWEAVVHARTGADLNDALIAETFRLYGCSEASTFDRDAARRFGWRLLSSRLS
jgi:predicted nucleic-acid-binding protein